MKYFEILNQFLSEQQPWALKSDASKKGEIVNFCVQALLQVVPFTETVLPNYFKDLQGVFGDFSHGPFEDPKDYEINRKLLNQQNVLQKIDVKQLRRNKI